MSDSLPFQNEKARRRIIASFWLVALCLGVPVWWRTTSIERRGLPRAEVERWKARGDCPLRFPLRVRAPPESSLEPGTFAGILRAAAAFGRTDAAASVDARTAACADFRVEATAPGLEVAIPHPADPFDPLGATSFGVPPGEASPLPVLQYLAAQADSTPDGQDPYAAPYSGRYKLLFSLMNEDASRGASVSGWEIRKAVEEHLSVTLTQLAPAHNFTVETRVEHFSPITLEAQPVPTGAGEEGVAWVVEETELMAFINEAGWNIASPVSVEPVLHFVLWVPAEDRRPFRIRRADGTLAETNGFIRPRWGSVIIYNPPPSVPAIAPSAPPHPTAQAAASVLAAPDLRAPMRRFHADLLRLLGVSPLPAPLDAYPSVHPLQLEAVLRRRTLEAAREAIMSLDGIVELAQKQTNMRVGKDVQDQVRGALRELDLAAESLAAPGGPPAAALEHARRARQLANLAFFNPSMLALLYFPDEHKYAVYTPLFGPLAVPMVASVVKELKAWRKKRREMEDAKTRKRD